MLDWIAYVPDWFWPMMAVTFVAGMIYAVLYGSAQARHSVRCPQCGAWMDDRRPCRKCGHEY